MNATFKSYLIETSLYYILAIVGLPLIYAATYHLPFLSLYSTDWLIVSLVASPIILIISAARSGYQLLKKRHQIKDIVVKETH